jgi:predicted deacylase
LTSLVKIWFILTPEIKDEMDEEQFERQKRAIKGGLIHSGIVKVNVGRRPAPRNQP